MSIALIALNIITEPDTASRDESASHDTIQAECHASFIGKRDIESMSALLVRAASQHVHACGGKS